MLLGALAKIFNVDVALIVALDGHDFKPGHDRAGRIGAVSGHRNQTDIAMPFAALALIRANDQQSGIFALRARVGLQRNARAAR